jgi:hypothetical protein
MLGPLVLPSGEQPTGDGPFYEFAPVGVTRHEEGRDEVGVLAAVNRGQEVAFERRVDVIAELPLTDRLAGVKEPLRPC